MHQRPVYQRAADLRPGPAVLPDEDRPVASDELLAGVARACEHRSTMSIDAT